MIRMDLPHQAKRVQLRPVILICLSICCLPASALSGYQSTLLPKPYEESYGTDVVTLAPVNFKFEVVGKSSKVLEEAIKRYRGWTFWKTGGHMASSEPSLESLNFLGSLISSLSINVTSSSEELNRDTDYAYELRVTSQGAYLESPTAYGSLYGLETFSQLMEYIGENAVAGHGYRISGIPVTIKDKPRFSYRGLLVDTSRHYLHLSTIIRNLDVMAWHKLNVMHWHIVDEQAFPYVSKTFPRLSGKGAYNAQHTYTMDDVRLVIEEAKLRGIRVVAEFDTPGHTESWGRGHPEIMSHCPGPSQPLDPSNEKTYDFLEKLYEELAGLFPEEYMHLGGDEVSFDCWSKDPTVTDWMKKENITTYAKAEEYFASRLLSIVTKLGKKAIVWQEMFNNGLKLAADTVIDVWMGGYDSKTITEATKAGYHVVLSGCWYLDNTGASWQDYYRCEPQAFNGTPEEMSRVMGGHASMWGERVDLSNFFGRIWPRTSAIAERLWSKREVRDEGDAGRRLSAQRCRIIRRGVPAEPWEPGYCDEELEDAWGLSKSAVTVLPGGVEDARMSID